MNVGIFSGNLGRDAELNSTTKDNVLNFSIGVNVGSKQEPETMWVTCALWGKRAESLKQYLVKGTKVTVSGQVKLRTYTKKDGGTGSELYVNVNEVDLHGSGEKQAPRPAGEPSKANGFQPQPKSIDEMADDIPF